MFFIVPAFLYCLMFTNLQPRFLMIIFQSTMDNDANFRMAICKFNLFHYGSLFAIYPLLLFTNFNWAFFIGMSCIIFPQIYANGFNNARPDISSPYYTKYLFSRFIIIVTHHPLSSTSSASPETSSSSSPTSSWGSSASPSFPSSTASSSSRRCMAPRKCSLPSCWSPSTTTSFTSSLILRRGWRLPSAPSASLLSTSSLPKTRESWSSSRTRG